VTAGGGARGVGARRGGEAIEGLTVLWRSEREVVVDKPAGLASESPYGSERDSVLTRVRRWCGEAKLPHRLDAMTSGVLVVALDDEAVRWHNAEVAARRWRKFYVARVGGTGGERRACGGGGERDGERGGADGLLGEHVVHLKRKGKRAEVVRAGGQRAALTVLAAAADPAVHGARQVLLELHTGRFHQVRATLAHAGAPLVGDGLYGGVGAAGSALLRHVALRFRPTGDEGTAWVRAGAGGGTDVRTEGRAGRGTGGGAGEVARGLMDTLARIVAE